MYNQKFFKLMGFRKLLRYLYFTVSVLIIFSITSCVKDGDFEFDKLAKNQFDPSIAAPFINSRLTLQDILKDTSGIVQVNSDNTLKLIYNSNNLVSIMAKDLFEIPNQSLFTDTANMVFPPIAAGDSIYVAITKPFEFTNMPKPDQRLDLVSIKNAVIKLDIISEINHSCKLVLKSSSITYANGDSLEVVIPITYTGGPSTHVNKDIDISGCKINFNNSPGHKNELMFFYKTVIYGDGNANNPNNRLTFKSDIINIKYDKLLGYIGQYDFPLNDTTLLSVFNTQLAGQFELNNVKISAKVDNSYGLPIEIKIDKFQAQNGNNVVNITDFPPQNPFNLLYPTVIGQSATTNIPSTTSNDLANAINISPKKIIYKVTGKANPANNPLIQNFVIDTSKFNVSINVELPLEGKVGGFVLQDTLEMELDKIKDVKELSFRINTTNAFPLGANVQVYFTDNLFHVLDSMITNGADVIQAGIVNPTTQLVVTPSSKLTEVSISNERLRKIENTKKLIIKARLTSYGYPAQVIKITNNDYIDVKLGMKAKVNIQQ